MTKRLKVLVFILFSLLTYVFVTNVVLKIFFKDTRTQEEKTIDWFNESYQKHFFNDYDIEEEITTPPNQDSTYSKWSYDNSDFGLKIAKIPSTWNYSRDLSSSPYVKKTDPYAYYDEYLFGNNNVDSYSVDDWMLIRIFKSPRFDKNFEDLLGSSWAKEKRFNINSTPVLTYESPQNYPYSHLSFIEDTYLLVYKYIYDDGIIVIEFHVGGENYEENKSIIFDIADTIEIN